MIKTELPERLLRKTVIVNNQNGAIIGFVWRRHLWSILKTCIKHYSTPFFIQCLIRFRTLAIMFVVIILWAPSRKSTMVFCLNHLPRVFWPELLSSRAPPSTDLPLANEIRYLICLGVMHYVTKVIEFLSLGGLGDFICFVHPRQNTFVWYLICSTYTWCSVKPHFECFYFLKLIYVSFHPT